MIEIVLSAGAYILIALMFVCFGRGLSGRLCLIVLQRLT